MFFHYEHGKAFEPCFEEGRRKTVHMLYPALLREQFPQDKIREYFRFTVVRDPIRRFISAYANKVLDKKKLGTKLMREKLDAIGLDPMPDIETFIRNLDAYQTVNGMLLHHTRPATDFIGVEPDFTIVSIA